MVLLHTFCGFMDQVSVNQSLKYFFANSFQLQLAKRSCGWFILTMCKGISVNL